MKEGKPTMSTDHPPSSEMPTDTPDALRALLVKLKWAISHDPQPDKFTENVASFVSEAEAPPTVSPNRDLCGAEIETRYPHALLRHALNAPSQYTPEFRLLAAEILRLRAALTAVSRVPEQEKPMRKRGANRIHVKMPRFVEAAIRKGLKIAGSIGIEEADDKSWLTITFKKLPPSQPER